MKTQCCLSQVQWKKDSKVGMNPVVLLCLFAPGNSDWIYSLSKLEVFFLLEQTRICSCCFYRSASLASNRTVVYFITLMYKTVCFQC